MITAILPTRLAKAHALPVVRRLATSNLRHVPIAGLPSHKSRLFALIAAKLCKKADILVSVRGYLETVSFAFLQFFRLASIILVVGVIRKQTYS